MCIVFTLTGEEGAVALWLVAAGGGKEGWGGLQSCVNCDRCLTVPFDLMDSVLEQRTGQ